MEDNPCSFYHNLKYAVNPLWPLDLMDPIRRVISTPCAAPVDPELSFKILAEAANKNFCVLWKYNIILDKAIEAQKDSPLVYG